ncbi:hypothetical protein [Aquirhabdus parva]|uniref:Uncharacterized protein n=1 Tax=Aquirhabdus parva TaxID=2283318 RepID=A0A345P395_9GAMM|nr:hypothetical protein [Aquirhabdus parva]AXI01754.1 hypothetical protein HYN46_01970 [Aquirhabdus parva]
MDLAEQLAVFAEKGNQQRIHLTDGRTLQGWIMEIREDDLLMSTGFSEKQGKDDWIPFTSIHLDQLQYWDTQQSLWAPFTIDPQ